jgi:phage FluMu protein Com
VIKVNEIKENVRCPKCMKIVSVTGNADDVIKLKCPACGFVGNVTFRKTEYIIEAENVHKVYTTGKIQVHALRGVNLKVKKRRNGYFNGCIRLRKNNIT